MPTTPTSLPTVLLTGGRAPVTLELARAFWRAGWRVLVAESVRYPLTRWSCAVSRSYRVPPPNRQPRQFADALREIAVREQVHLLLPTCEEIFWVARFHAHLSEVCTVFCEPLERLRPLHDKYQFQAQVRQSGLPALPTALLTSAADVAHAFAQPGEWVFKPVYSRFATQTLLRPKNLPVIQATAANPWVAQQFVKGKTICTYSIAHAGKVLAHVCYAVEYQAGQGAAIFYRAFSHSATQAWVAQFLAFHQLSGQFAFDFIENEMGELFALECNPRATSGIHLLAADPRLVACYNNMLSLQLLTPAPTTRPQMALLAMWLYGLPDALQRGKFRQWLADLHAGQDTIWRSWDALAMLGQFCSLGEFLWRGWRAGVSPLVASTLEIEWNGD